MGGLLSVDAPNCHPRTHGIEEKAPGAWGRGAGYALRLPRALEGNEQIPLIWEEAPGERCPPAYSTCLGPQWCLGIPHPHLQLFLRETFPRNCLSGPDSSF